MNANEIPGEPHLSPDFARRVLREADIVVARRQRVRRLAMGSGAVAVLALAIVFGAQMFPPRANAPRTQPAITGTDAENVPLAQAERTDPLSTMFPDAVPVARFAEQYSGATDEPTDLLFADDAAGTDEVPD